ncbi:hypothetical protein M3226_25435 [Neobacillus cucumis]|uniref:hypothetical protein n=1 Tax=Neobacillus cucumis TaxID=1740721 RepID=UPI00203C6BE2|nr:hypothetical protein [Neobacillus cucumis]MCM3728989.1 hypothetical protein [Neobacillus cucumis]
MNNPKTFAGIAGKTIMDLDTTSVIVIYNDEVITDSILINKPNYVRKTKIGTFRLF